MNEKKQSSFKSLVNQLEDLKNFIPPINAAGYPFIVLFAIIALILSLISDFLGWIGFIFLEILKELFLKIKTYLFHLLMVKYYSLVPPKVLKI